jgi:hypothetical protein
MPTIPALVAAASQVLSSITRLAGVVMVPRQAHVALSQIEFIGLSENRVLAILVTNDREVHNRVLQLDRRYSPSSCAAPRTTSTSCSVAAPRRRAAPAAVAAAGDPRADEHPDVDAISIAQGLSRRTPAATRPTW